MRCFATVLVSACALHGLAAERIIYELISADARKLGRLDKYAQMPKQEIALELGRLKLSARVPTDGEAYDPVPIEYTLTGDAGDHELIAVEATAFEDEVRRKGRDLYDLALPGNMKIKIEYLGSQTGIFDPTRVTRLSPTSRHDIYPPYVLEPFVRSGTVKRGNYLFFKFRVTNVGDTIFDPEGFGGWMTIPDAMTLKPDGSFGRRYGTINEYERHLDYLYPGESFEQWVSFFAAGQDVSRMRTLPAGKFVLRHIAAYRYNREYNWGINMWAGKPWADLEVNIEVTESGGQSPVTAREVDLDGDEDDRMTRYVASLEEFMTAFKVHQRSELSNTVRGTIYLQVAPWTRQVVLKLIGNRPGQIRTAALPINISSTNLTISPQTRNPFMVSRAGRREPAVFTQMMPAMRTNIQLGPEPDKHLRERLREAMECGINVICSTGGDWHLPEIVDGKAFFGDVQSETFKHYYDVIVPELGLPVFGWAHFPPKTANPKLLGELMLGRKFDIPGVNYDVTYSHRPELDIAHPDFPRVYAAAVLFNHQRWGRMWYRTADGDVLIDMEDTWGWLRDDIQLRYYMGPLTVERFRRWAAAKYRRIEQVNKAWGTAYKGFDEIDPQKDHADGGNMFGTDLTRMRPEYTNLKNPFHDWSPAVNDWDTFRTELRCDLIAALQRHLREAIPRAWINLRTEGAILPVSVPADSQDPHLRHVYYSQRRNALVAEVLKKRKVLKYHSDYTTLPYSESEWRLLLRKLREEGIRGSYLPQFCTARDMVLTDTYGRDYQIHYNLAEPRRATMMHVLQAAYPVWRIMYEEGHCPGVLWEDYQCDGFVSETQKRELRLFREQLNRFAR